jgi:plasmid stabilization system protein ParE
MAYQIIITEKFENSAAKTSQWIEREWSLKLSLEFDKKLSDIINELSLNPNMGRLSARKNIRSFRVTKHNRVYYKISKNQITFLDLFESKQNPKRNKYE